MSTPLSLQFIRFTNRAAELVAPRPMGRYWAYRFMTPIRHPRPDWEKAILAQGKPLPLESGQKAWVWGEGPTVLLVHGWDGRGSQLGHFVKPLVDGGFQVVAWDGPAHGDSPGKWTNLAFFARALIALEKEIGPLHGIVAHSFGAGSSALGVGWGLKTKKLVLIASPCSIQGVFDRFCEFIGAGPRVARVLQTTIEKIAGIQAQDAQIDELKNQVANLPALLFHDPDDREVPYSEAVKIAAAWPNARLVTTEKVGHRRILKHPPVLEETVRFLRA